MDSINPVRISDSRSSSSRGGGGCGIASPSWAELGCSSIDDG